MAGVEILKRIDHTYLKPEGGRKTVRQLCREAVEYGFYAVCIHPAYVEAAHDLLAGGPVKLAAVVGFPLGASTPATKAFEAAEAVRSGADEIDMVIALGMAKEGEWAAVEADVRAVVQAAGVPVKAILECGLLEEAEVVRAAEAAVRGGASFVKTSTGFGPRGASLDDVRLLRRTVGPGIGVKASGGIRTLEDVRRFLEAGADRIGTSSGVVIATTLFNQGDLR